MTTTTTMIIGGDHARASPTVQIPPWDPLGDPTAAGVVHSPYSGVTSPTVGLNGNSNAREHYCGCCYDLTALRRYLPSNEPADGDGEEFELHASCDEFRMYEFKVRRCARGRSHDWTECPYAHPGEKARRRDPRRFLYSGTACPDFRKGACKKGDSCEFAHGVFECWLHPERYRTQPCKDGQNCRRRVCFFAHSPDQLRVLSPRSTNSAAAEAEFGSPIRPGPTAAAAAFDSYFSKPGSFMSSPTSILTSPSISPPTDSPPMSPNRPAQIACGSPGSVGDLLTSMRNMQIGKMKMSPRGQIGSVFGSPLRPGCYASPFSPKTESPGYGLGGGLFDPWETHCEEEPAMERVESGRDLRAKIYAKLSRELSLERADVTASGPDVGWVSELVK